MYVSTAQKTPEIHARLCRRLLSEKQPCDSSAWFPYTPGKVFPLLLLLLVNLSLIRGDPASWPGCLTLLGGRGASETTAYEGVCVGDKANLYIGSAGVFFPG